MEIEGKGLIVPASAELKEEGRKVETCRQAVSSKKPLLWRDRFRKGWGNWGNVKKKGGGGGLQPPASEHRSKKEQKGRRRSKHPRGNKKGEVMDEEGDPECEE